MANDMATYMEVWPVAADHAGIWLLSGADAWRSAIPLQSDTDPQGEVELLLAGHGVTAPQMLHSTSWRADLPRLILTYIAVIDAGPAVRATWPQALPVSLDLPGAVGKPFPHGPAEAPTVRAVDVLRPAPGAGRDVPAHRRRLTLSGTAGRAPPP
jgi:hypothetical protein